MSETAPAPKGLAATAVATLGVLAGAIFVGAIAGAVHRRSDSPMFAVLGAAAYAALFGAVGALAVSKILLPALNEDAPGNAPAVREDGTLGRVLAELERVRRTTKAAVVARAVKVVPLTLGAAVAFWVWGQFSTGEDVPGVVELATFSACGVAAGYVIASQRLTEAYRRRYKLGVLPLLAAQLGALTYREAQPNLDIVARHRIFATFDAHTCEDEILGRYRGLPLSIVELKLTYGSGKNQRTVFDGLLTTVALPRGLEGTTVVAPDLGKLGNWMERSKIAGCEPVRVEDPTFEKAYQVYATDQISARALLTPAFMERFLALAASGRFGKPLALVQDNQLLIALPKTDGKNLFEPPSYLKPAAGRQGLSDLVQDLKSVLSMADAVIDLDQAARAQATRPT